MTNFPKEVGALAAQQGKIALKSIMKWFTLIILASLTIGCQTYKPRYTFQSIGTQSNDPAGHIGAKTDTPVKAEITYQGIEKQKESQTKVLRFDMTLKNNSDNTVVLNPQKFALLDDEARRFSSGEEIEGNSVILQPNSTKELTLLFALPASYNVAEVGSFRLTWEYEKDSQVYRRLSKFIKRSAQYRYYNSDYYYGWTTPQYFGRYRGRFGLSYGCY